MASPGYGSPSIKQIIHHGSEGQRSTTSDPESFTRGPGAPNRAFGEVPTANLTEEANRERLGISVEPFLGSASPQIKQKKHIWDMDKVELTDYMERQGCSQETLATITNEDITGRTLQTIMTNDMWDNILSEELKISNRITRFKIKSEMQTTAPTGQTEQEEKQKNIRSANEKMSIPKLEKPQLGHTHITTVQWESYAKAIESWLSVGDGFLSAVAASLFANPEQEIDELMQGKMNDLQTHIDSVWATSLMESTYITVDTCLQRHQYQLNGKSSGLKIISTVGKLVNKKTTNRKLLTMRELLKMPPTRTPDKLFSDLGQLSTLMQGLAQQGDPIQPFMRLTLLQNLVSDLMERPDMMSHLVAPIALCKERYPDDPDRLYQVIMNAAETLCTDGASKSTGRADRFRNSYRKPTEGTFAADKTDPRPCISVREGQKCTSDRCRKQHTGMTGKKCTDSDYTKYGICANYLECKDKHPWDSKFGDKNDALIAYRNLKGLPPPRSRSQPQRPGQIVAASIMIKIDPDQQNALSDLFDISDVSESDPLGINIREQSQMVPYPSGNDHTPSNPHLISRYGDGDVGTPQSPVRSNDIPEGAQARYLDDDVDHAPTVPPANATMQAPPAEHEPRAKRTAAKVPTALDIDRVRALLEDVDLDEWYYAIEDEQFSPVNSEDTDSQDAADTQTNNSFVTEQTDPDPNSESWHPDTGTEADTTTDTLASDWMDTIATLDTSKHTPPGWATPSSYTPPSPTPTPDQQLTEGKDTEAAVNGLSMMQLFKNWESHVMMNMVASNKRPRPIEDAVMNLKRTNEMPTYKQYGAVWNQLTDMGHDEELVRMWAIENDIIAKGQECYDKIAAPVAMQHDDHIVGASQDQSIRILIDGGSFHHNFGTDTVKYRTNIRSITPFPITTAGGITWLDKQCDLNMPGIILTNGYINDHLHITLLSEGILAKEKDWSFKTDVHGKLCTHPQGSFRARSMGHLFYLPNHIIGIPPMVMAGVDELMAAMDEPDADDEMHRVYESEGEEAAAPDHDPAE